MKEGRNEDDIDYLLRQFPVTYAVTFCPSKSARYWCFTIPYEFHKYDFVLGIGVSLEEGNLIDKVFMIPTKDLGKGNISIFSEGDMEYSRYYIKDGEMEQKVHTIMKEVF